VKKENFTKIGRLLTDHTKDASIYNTAPAISPSGTKIAFVSDRNGYADMYAISAIDGKVLHHLIRGERSGGFESFHILQGGISWSNDEKFLVFVAKSHGKDNIVVVDYPSGKTKKRLRYNLDGISSPSLSPDNKRVCFIGLKNGYADVYIADLKDGALTRVTYDYYEDRDPTFTPDGKAITFISDRPDFDSWQPGAYALFQVLLDAPTPNVGGGRDNNVFSRALQLEPISGIPRSQYLSKPVYMSDGHLIFTAADSSYNVYIYSMSGKNITNRTDFAGGVYYPSISKDNSKLAFSYYMNYGWDIGVIDDPLKNIPVVASESLTMAQENWQKYEPVGIDQNKVSPYKFSLSPDYAVGQASYSTQGSVAGQLDIALSDALGNHRFYLTTNLYQDISNSDIYFDYWYLQKRVNWGFGLFQYLEYPEVYQDFIWLRRNRGLEVLGSYPFDKFTRVEFGTIGYLSYNEIYELYPDNIWYMSQAFREHILLLDEAFVFDNTVWNDWGPYKGTRTRLESYQSIPISSRKFYTSYLDFRNYFKLSTRYSFATWLYGIGSFGPHPELFSIGAENVRGYEYQEFYDNPGTKSAILSLELRHPLIDRLKIAYPIPFELSNIRGVTFFDAGMVFNDSTKMYENGQGFKDLKLGVGAGVRMQISYFLLKVDFAKPLSATENKHWKVYFGLGTDF
jgi:Tol biopolymer transport system component